MTPPPTHQDTAMTVNETFAVSGTWSSRKGDSLYLEASTTIVDIG